MSVRGVCYNNACYGIFFFHTLKGELVYRENYRSKNEVSITCYIKGYYNRKRRHSAINYNIPLLYDKSLVVTI